MGPENRTATSNDNFLRVNLIGDFAGYTNIPTFEDFYLVIPRQVYLLHRHIFDKYPFTLIDGSKKLAENFLLIYLLRLFFFFFGLLHYT